MTSHPNVHTLSAMSTRKYTFRLDPKLIAQIDRAARQCPVPLTRTHWLREAAAEKLAGKKAKKESK